MTALTVAAIFSLLHHSGHIASAEAKCTALNDTTSDTALDVSITNMTPRNETYDLLDGETSDTSDEKCDDKQPSLIGLLSCFTVA